MKRDRKITAERRERNRIEKERKNKIKNEREY
jgi:hypothetical protein